MMFEAAFAVGCAGVVIAVPVPENAPFAGVAFSLGASAAGELFASPEGIASSVFSSVIVVASPQDSSRYQECSRRRRIHRSSVRAARHNARRTVNTGEPSLNAAEIAYRADGEKRDWFTIA